MFRETPLVFTGSRTSLEASAQPIVFTVAEGIFSSKAGNSRAEISWKSVVGGWQKYLNEVLWGVFYLFLG